MKHTANDTKGTENNVERIKSAYITTSKALVDMSISDTAKALGVKLTHQESLYLEQWAIIHKFDQAITDLVGLRNQMTQALIQVRHIQAGVFQAQQIAYKSFIDQQSFDTTPLPDPFLEQRHPPAKDTKK